jgi:hypothetical protein
MTGKVVVVVGVLSCCRAIGEADEVVDIATRNKRLIQSRPC